MDFDIRIITTSIVAIINAVSIALMYLIYSNDAKSRITKIFIQMTIIMLVWVDFAYLARIPDHGNMSLLWIRIAWAITPFLFVLIYFFAKEFVEKEVETTEKLALLVLGLIYFFIILLTDLVIRGIEFNEQGVLQIIYGNITISLIALSFLFFLSFLSIMVFVKQFINSKNKKEKENIKYILLGIAFFMTMNSIFNIYYPYFKHIFHLYFFGDYSTSIFLILLAYTIVRNKLFSIKVFLAEILTFSIWMIFSLLLFWSDSWTERILNSVLFTSIIITGIFLINSVKKEIEQREKIEKIEKELQRAYEIEKKANEQLKALDDTKNQFFMAIQHHLRTPLTSMRGYADLLLDGSYGKTSKKVKDVIERFKVSTVNLIKMVNDFLDVTQFQLGKEVISIKQGVDLSDMLKQIVEDIQLEANKKKIYLTLENPEERCFISADESKLQVALVNIFDNCVKYTEKGGVAIKLNVEENKIKIKVKDTGMGIPKEKLEKLFSSPFERTEESKKSFATGRGIGLYLSGQIIKAHNGKLWAESEGEGKGSTFFIELPKN
jgi:signal transduction histidine kinase